MSLSAFEFQLNSKSELYNKCLNIFKTFPEKKTKKNQQDL